MQQCTICLLDKDLTLFPKGRRQCKECRNKVSNNSYFKKRDYYVEERRKHYRNNKEYHLKKNTTYYLKNKDRLDAYRRDWSRKDYSINPHKAIGRTTLRYTGKLKATPPWLTEEHIQEIEAIYSHARDCYLVSGQKYDVDHIVPLQGKNVCGLHVPWNLQVLPSDINRGKGNR